MSKPGAASNIKLNSLDTLFGNTANSNDIDPTKEEVIEVKLSDLHTFENHPFRVIDDEKMQETVDSIKEHGVLVPGIVRKRVKGGYEIISGHRRRRACELAGLETMPVFVRDLTDDEATIVMVDSNIQREEILPSEKAKAYKMKYDAMKHQGKSQGTGLRSLEQLSEETGDSKTTIQRYIKIADMNEDLLDLIDQKKMGITQGVELASLNEEEQEKVYEAYKETSTIPSLTQSAEIKDMSRRGEFDIQGVKNILEGKTEAPKVPKKEEKKQEIKDTNKNSKKSRAVTLKEDTIKKFFSDEYSEEEITDIILQLLKNWKENEKR